MENGELTRKFELVVIVDAKFNQEDKDSISKQIADAISKAGGKVINSQVWLEKHKLAFEIKKCDTGTYYLINFEGDSSVNEKLRATLRLSEKILRFAITKVGSQILSEATA